MIFFCAPECRHRFNLRYHWPGKTPAHIDLFPGCFRRRLLLGRMIKNHRAILRSNIRTLPVQCRGIVVRPEHLQKLIVRDLEWIEFHFHDFGVTGPVSAHIFVSRILFRSASITDCRRQHAFQIAESFFNSPKTACAKRCLFRSHQKQSGTIIRTVQPSESYNRLGCSLCFFFALILP